MTETVLLYAAMASSAVSAFGQYRQGQAQQVQAEIQARNEAIQGRLDAVNYRRQGTEILNNTIRAMAASTARTAAGGLNPFASGESADLINTMSLRTGVEDSNLARDNAQLALDARRRNSQSYLAAGKAAVQAGTAAAIGTIGSTFGQVGMSGGFTGNARTK